MLDKGRIFRVRLIGSNWEIMIRDEWQELPLTPVATLEDVTDHVAMFRDPPFTVRDVSRQSR